MTKLWLSNDGVFSTIQGEGKLTGVPSVFVRLNGCNLRCRWQNPDGSFTRCDTPYTSHAPERGSREEVDDLVKQVLVHGARHVVVTGGEPYMQSANLAVFLERLKAKDEYQHVTIETNGTMAFANRADLVSISPKLKSSRAPDPGVNPEHDPNGDVTLEKTAKLIGLNFDHQLKFVVNTPADLDEIDEFLGQLQKRVTSSFDPDCVYLMPQGTEASQLDERLPFIIDYAKSRGYCVTDRLHIRIWGHRRGV